MMKFRYPYVNSKNDVKIVTLHLFEKLEQVPFYDIKEQYNLPNSTEKKVEDKDKVLLYNKAVFLHNVWQEFEDSASSEREKMAVKYISPSKEEYSDAIEKNTGNDKDKEFGFSWTLAGMLETVSNSGRVPAHCLTRFDQILVTGSIQKDKKGKVIIGTIQNLKQKVEAFFLSDLKLFIVPRESYIKFLSENQDVANKVTQYYSIKDFKRKYKKNVKKDKKVILAVGEEDLSELIDILFVNPNTERIWYKIVFFLIALFFVSFGGFYAYSSFSICNPFDINCTFFGYATLEKKDIMYYKGKTPTGSSERLSESFKQDKIESGVIEITDRKIFYNSIGGLGLLFEDGYSGKRIIWQPNLMGSFDIGMPRFYDGIEMVAFNILRQNTITNALETYNELSKIMSSRMVQEANKGQVRKLYKFNLGNNIAQTVVDIGDEMTIWRSYIIEDEINYSDIKDIIERIADFKNNLLQKRIDSFAGDISDDLLHKTKIIKDLGCLKYKMLKEFKYFFIGELQVALAKSGDMCKNKEIELSPEVANVFSTMIPVDKEKKIDETILSIDKSIENGTYKEGSFCQRLKNDLKKREVGYAPKNMKDYYIKMTNLLEKYHENNSIIKNSNENLCKINPKKGKVELSSVKRNKKKNQYYYDLELTELLLNENGAKALDNSGCYYNMVLERTLIWRTYFDQNNGFNGEKEIIRNALKNIKRYFPYNIEVMQYEYLLNLNYLNFTKSFRIMKKLLEINKDMPEIIKNEQKNLLYMRPCKQNMSFVDNNRTLLNIVRTAIFANNKNIDMMLDKILDSMTSEELKNFYDIANYASLFPGFYTELIYSGEIQINSYLSPEGLTPHYFAGKKLRKYQEEHIENARKKLKALIIKVNKLYEKSLNKL